MILIIYFDFFGRSMILRELEKPRNWKHVAPSLGVGGGYGGYPEGWIPWWTFIVRSSLEEISTNLE